MAISWLILFTSWVVLAAGLMEGNLWLASVWLWVKNRLIDRTEGKDLARKNKTLGVCKQSIQRVNQCDFPSESPLSHTPSAARIVVRCIFSCYPSNLSWAVYRSSTPPSPFVPGWHPSSNPVSSLPRAHRHQSTRSHWGIISHPQAGKSGHPV